VRVNRVGLWAGKIMLACVIFEPILIGLEAPH
jgi:hypothetical protein